MAREKYNAEKEHQIIGTYPGINGMELGGGVSGGVTIIPESPEVYRPITPCENYKMAAKGKKPYWIPSIGWFYCDLNQFRPRQQADNRANHQCIDGGEWIDYSKVPRVQIGWFNCELEWEPNAMGCTVRPGNPQLPEMDGWREKIHFPDLDTEVDWEEMREMNKTYMATSKANQLGIQMGFWERLMDLMDVNNAAMALLDEDQEDNLHEFLDKLADLYIDYIGRVKNVVDHLDAVFFHDDWGTQNGPFFSLETARKFFVPPMKKVVDFCHANDIVFEHHCCGNAGALVPAMIETGSDYWLPQPAINDVDALVMQYKGQYRFGVCNPLIPVGSTVEDAREIARQYVERYKDCNVLVSQNVAYLGTPESDDSLYPVFLDAVYEYSRLAYQDEEE